MYITGVCVPQRLLIPIIFSIFSDTGNQPVYAWKCQNTITGSYFEHIMIAVLISWTQFTTSIFISYFILKCGCVHALLDKILTKMDWWPFWNLEYFKFPTPHFDIFIQDLYTWIISRGKKKKKYIYIYIYISGNYELRQKPLSYCQTNMHWFVCECVCMYVCICIVRVCITCVSVCVCVCMLACTLCVLMWVCVCVCVCDAILILFTTESIHIKENTSLQYSNH